MFESVVTAVLNKFLGDYVANLEQNQLNLGIFSGNVVLDELQLKKEALDKLNLPVEIFYGHLGKLELHIPWRNLKTQPVSVIIEDLFLLAGPRVETEYDPVMEEERAQKAKQERLEAVELFSSSMENQLSQDIKQESFTTQLVTKIVDNLQVTVKNIHIRFEDSSSNPERIFSVGFILKSLTAVSTDCEWRETFIVDPQDAVNKLVKLDSFSLYWNTREPGMQSLSYEDFIAKCKERIDDDSHSFILRPVSGIGKVILNKFFKEGIPKTILDIIFDSFALNVNYEQYFDILSSLAALSTAQRALSYRKYRPREKNISPIDLFRYAITCYQAKIHARNQRRTWKYVLQRRYDRKEYINLFSNRIILGQLNPEDETRLTMLERRIEFEDLVNYRSLARAFAKKTMVETPKSVGSRFWGWLGYKSAANSELVKDEDIQELYETIGYDSSQPGANENIPLDTQMLQVNFVLDRGSFSISQDPGQTDSIVSLLFSDLTARFIKRPKTIRVEFSLRDLSLIEHLVPETLFKEVIKMKPGNPGSPKSEKPLLFVSYEQLTRNPEADTEVYLALRPLLMVINMIAADRLMSFLLNNRTKTLLEALKSEAKHTIEVIGTRTRANLQKALEEHKGIDLSVDIDAPIIMIPEDPTDISRSIFVIDLGQLKARTVLVTLEDKKKVAEKRRELSEEETEEFHEMLYDKIRVSLEKFGVYYAPTISLWQELLSSEGAGREGLKHILSPANKLIDEIDVELSIENSIIPFAANIAKTKINATIAEISAYISDEKVGKIMTIVNQLPKSSKEANSKNGKDSLPRVKKNSNRRVATKAMVKVCEVDDEPEEFFDAFDDADSFSPRDNDSKGFVEEEDPLGVLLDFKIKSIMLNVSKHDENSKETIVLSLLARDMGLDLKVFETLTLLNFHLGGLAIKEHLSNPLGFVLIDGEMQSIERDLLTISLTMVNPSNKDFSTVYREIERSIVLKLSSVLVFLEPERVYRVAEFLFSDFLPALESGSKVEQRSFDGGPSESITLDLLKEYQPKSEMTLEFSQFKIFLIRGDNSNCATLQADTLSLFIAAAGKRLVLTGDISSLEISGSSCSEESTNSNPTIKLVYFEGGSVAQFGFETGHSGDDDYLVGSNLFQLNTGQLCIVYEPEVYASLAVTIGKFLEITKVINQPNGNNKSKELVEHSKNEDDDDPLTRDHHGVLTYLKIELESPVILFPSADHNWSLGFYLGKLFVRNSFKSESGGDGGGLIIDQIFSIKLSDVHISLIEKVKEELVRPILNRFTIPITLRKSQNAPGRNYAEMEVDGTVDDVIASLSESDYKMVMEIIIGASLSIPKILNAALPKEDSTNAANLKPIDDSETLLTVEKFLFDIKLFFKSIQVQIKDDFDSLKTHLCIEGITTTFISHSKRGTSVESCVDSVRITDVSDPNQCFRELFVLGAAATGYNIPLVDSKKQLLFRMDRSIIGDSIINVYVESPRIFVLFDTIFYLQKFFTTNLPVVGNKPSSPNIPPINETDSTLSSPAPPPPTATTILYNMIDASVIIVDDCKVSSTEAIALRVGSVALKISKDISLAVDELSCFVFNTVAASETKITIVEEFSTTLQLEKDDQVSPQSNSTLDWTIQPVVVTISFQDLQLFQSILNQMDESKKRHLPTSTLPNQTTEESTLMGANIKKIANEQGNVAIDYLRLIIIDDSSSSIVPLFDLSLDKVAFKMSDWSSKLRANLNVTISSNCYNPAISYWEPIIESWPFSVAIGPSEVESNADNVIMMSSTRGLDMLLVHHSIERILQMLQKLESNERRSSSESRKISSPYRVTNYIDCDISISASSSPSEKLWLNSQKSTEYSFEDWRQLRSSFFKKSHSISLGFESFLPIFNISLNRDGYHKILLETVERIDEEEEDPRTIYIHTFLVDGVRHVHFRESIMVHNETSQPFMMIFEGSEDGTTLELLEGQSVCIPPWHMTSTCTLVPLGNIFRPAPNPLYFDRSLLSNEEVMVCCKAISDEGTPTPPLYFQISTVKPASSSSNDIIDVSFVPPLKVENFLPCQVQIQFLQDETRVVKTFNEGQSLPVYEVDPMKTCLVGISIPSLGLFSTNEENLYLIKDRTSLCMQNEEGLELKVSMSKSIFSDSKTVLLTISAYYLLVNQTGLTVQVQSEAYFKDKRVVGQVFSVPPVEDAKPILIFSHPNVKSVKNRARIRVSDSGWSEPISFEAVGAEVEFHCKSMLSTKWYNLGGFVGLGQGKFAVTKIVYLSPRYFVVNDSDTEIMINDSESVYTIPAKAQVAVHLNPTNVECITMKVTGSEYWSAPFDIKNAGKVYVREEHANQLFRISRTIHSPNFFISFSSTDSWPFVIRNLTTMSFKISQKNVDKYYECQPKSDLNYSWDQPAFYDKRLILSLDSRGEYSIDLSEVGKSMVFKVKADTIITGGGQQGSPIRIGVEIKAEGPAVVMIIKDGRVGLEEAVDELEIKSGYVEAFQNVILVRIPYLAISLIGPDMEEFLLVYIKDLEGRYGLSKEFISYGLTIKWLQIDNQSFDWDHPILLYPAVLSKSKQELERHPFLSLGIIQSKDKSYGVTYYKYFGLLLQEISLEVGEELLRRLLSFSNFSLLTTQSKTIVSESDYRIKKFAPERDSSEVLFFEFFQMHPIKVNLTFSRTEDSSGAKMPSYNPMATIIDVLTMTMGNISDAPLKFNALVLENILSRKDSLREIVMEHYKQEGLSQIHKVLGSADFLGNPVGLVSTLGSGVTDLFYEPYQGFVSDRPQDIGIGFARGGLSLVKKTVSGLTGTLSKFTGSLAKGLSAATMDKSFQQKRRIDRAKNKPRHALSGVSTGVKQLYTGVKSGITGVVDKPLEGAKEGGVGGFFKGVGVGLVGIVTKPMVGLIDMTTSMTEGIKSSADDNQNAVSQVRFPRIIPFDEKIKPYNEREAFGQSIMANVIGVSKMGQEYYVAHLDVPGDNSIVILSDQRIFYASLERLKASWQVELTNVTDLNTTPDSILIFIHDEVQRTKVIPIIDPETQKVFSFSLVRLKLLVVH